MRYFGFLITLGFFAAVGSPQGLALAGFSPVPTVVSGSNIPDGSPQFVFLRPSIRQLTISYPEGLASGVLSGPRRSFQVDLINQVVPMVSTAITVNSDGTLDYAQTVQNGTKASQHIRVWGLSIPSTLAVSQTSHPIWKAAQENAAAPRWPREGLRRERSTFARRIFRASPNTHHLRIRMALGISRRGRGLACRGRSGKLLILRLTPRGFRRLRLDAAHGVMKGFPLLRGE